METPPPLGGSGCQSRGSPPGRSYRYLGTHLLIRRIRPAARRPHEPQFLPLFAISIGCRDPSSPADRARSCGCPRVLLRKTYRLGAKLPAGRGLYSQQRSPTSTSHFFCIFLPNWPPNERPAAHCFHERGCLNAAMPRGETSPCGMAEAAGPANITNVSPTNASLTNAGLTD